ncbi:peptidoglycan D,D-transpeptidase FtsI family protein [Planctomycetota bacterium]
MRRLRLIAVLFMGIIFILLALMGRCLFLQVLSHDYYQDKCLHQQRSLTSQRAPRGAILDAQGRILAASNQVRTVFVEPRLIHQPKKTATQLAEVLNVGAHILCQKIMESRNPGYVKLWDNATWEQAQAVRRFPGVGVQYEWQRYYPMDELCSHLVGFTNVDGGQGGVEGQYDRYLKGESAELRFLADHRRRPVSLYTAVETKTASGGPGEGVILTLDSTIQQFAREELSKQIATFEAEAGFAVVADPRNGAILALVSLPDFHPKEVGQASDDMMRNRAILDTYEPGSIMKPIVAAIALDAGVITRTEKIYCEDGVYIGKGFGRIGEYEDHKYGNLDVKGILINSSNIGMAKIGQKMGAEKLYRGLQLFGFGTKTGITLPGEGSGHVFTAQQMKRDTYTLARVPYGYGIAVTGIQMLRAYCVLANGGHLVQPHVVKAFVDEEGKRIMRDTGYDVAGDVGVIIDPEVAHWMVDEALAAVVSDEKGTGRRARLKRWRVFGKTGTARIAKKESRGYEEGAYAASFIAGAPAEDPRLVVMVSIRKPNRRLGKGYSGGPVASPVVGKIIERTLSYYESRGLIAAPPSTDDDSI